MRPSVHVTNIGTWPLLPLRALFGAILGLAQGTRKMVGELRYVIVITHS